MGKKEFANQQPTQNLAGRGRRGIQNTAHTKGKQSPESAVNHLTPPGNTVELKLGSTWKVLSPPSSPFLI